MHPEKTTYTLGTGLLCLFFNLLCYAYIYIIIFNLLCYAGVLKFLIYYTQYYAHVKELCLKSDCSIRVNSQIINIDRVYQVHNEYGDCSIRVITSLMSVLLEYIDLY